MTATTNWVGEYPISPAAILPVASPRDLFAALRGEKRNVRALGSRYSYSPCLHSPGALYKLGRGFDTSPWLLPGNCAYVGAATTINSLVLGLAASNPPRALRSIGGTSGQTLVGAITTGTHGAYFARALLSDDVVGVHLVNRAGHRFVYDDSAYELPSAALLAAKLNLAPDPVDLVPGAALLSAAACSLGGLGIIAGIFVRVREMVGTREYVSTTRSWRSVADWLKAGNALVSNPLGSTGEYATLEVFVLPHPSAAQASAILVTRSEAPEHVGVGQFRRPGLPEGKAVQAMIQLASADSDGATRLAVVEELVRGSRFEITKNYPWHVVANIGPANPLPVTSAEIQFGFATWREAVSFVEGLLDQIQSLLGDGQAGNPFPGFLTLRFGKPSSSLLAAAQPTSTNVLHVEIYVVNDILGGRRERPTPTSRRMLHRLLAWAQERGGRLHWGQYVPLDGNRIPLSSIVPPDATRGEWHRVRRELITSRDERAQYDNAMLLAARLGADSEPDE